MEGGDHNHEVASKVMMMMMMKSIISGRIDRDDDRNEDQKRKKKDDEEEVVELATNRSMLPGFRFHPTDEELVGFYLKRKVEKKPDISVHLIKQIDIYKYDPWDLPKVSSSSSRSSNGGMMSKEKEWYFFCKRGRKYRNSVRPNRVTGSGFWKATGIDKPVHHSNSMFHPECIGLKKSLVYYRGCAGKGTKTDWMMHEFRLPASPVFDQSVAKTDVHNLPEEAEVWTLCRIFKRIPSYKKYTPINCKLDNSKSYSTQNQPVSTTDSSSRTCSFESDIMSTGPDYNVGPLQDEAKPRSVVNLQQHHDDQHFCFNGRNQYSLRLSSLPANASYDYNNDDDDNNRNNPSFWINPMINNSNYSGDHRDFFTDGSWDELRPLVQLAIDDDPSHL